MKRTVAFVALLSGVTAMAWADDPPIPTPDDRRDVGDRAPDRASTPVPDPVGLHALADFRRRYRLAPGEIVKRIAPPFPPSRLADLHRRYPFVAERHRDDRILAIIYPARDGTLSNPSFTFSGDPKSEGLTLSALIEAITGFSPQDVEGDVRLLQAEVPGDFVFDAGAPAERRVAALERIIAEEGHLPARLAVREVECEVVVARGHFRFRPLEVGRNTVEIYGATLTPGLGSGGSGDFTEFLRWVGRFIEPHRRIVDEIESRPEGQLSWHLNSRSPFTDQMRREDHDEQAVLGHLAEQTGLTFTTERRKVPTLFVERVD
jgi:hypothetical protein